MILFLLFIKYLGLLLLAILFTFGLVYIYYKLENANAIIVIFLLLIFLSIILAKTEVHYKNINLHQNKAEVINIER